MKTIQFDSDNRPGISRIYAIPISSFLRIRKNYKKNTLNVEVKNRGDIIDIPMYTMAFQFNEEHSTEEAGETYSIAIEGRIPKLSQVNDSIIKILERGEWLVLHQDNNGIVHLSGTIDDPLTFNTNKSTGVGAESTNGYQFKFSAFTPESSIIVDMALISEL